MSGRTYITVVSCKCGSEYRHEGFALSSEAQRLLIRWKRDHECRSSAMEA